MQVFLKSSSYAIMLLRYGMWWMYLLFFILDYFLLFYKLYMNKKLHRILNESWVLRSSNELFYYCPSLMFHKRAILMLIEKYNTHKIDDQTIEYEIKGQSLKDISWLKTCYLAAWKNHFVLFNCSKRGDAFCTAGWMKKDCTQNGFVAVTVYYWIGTR